MVTIAAATAITVAGDVISDCGFERALGIVLIVPICSENGVREYLMSDHTAGILQVWCSFLWQELCFIMRLLQFCEVRW